MKKFVWRLQRLLEIRKKQEEVLRSELAGLTEQAAAVRGRIMVLRIRLKNQIDELAELPPDERLEAQALYLQHAPVLDGQIRKLQEQCKKLDLLRREKLQQVLVTRKGRKGLERLRAGARLEFERQYHAQEQKELDENTHTALIRRRFEAAI